jgi:hypothetical protein
MLIRKKKVLLENPAAMLTQSPGNYQAPKHSPKGPGTGARWAAECKLFQMKRRSQTIEF